MPRDVLKCIGNTSLLALRNIVPANGARILLKIESENPTRCFRVVRRAPTRSTASVRVLWFRFGSRTSPITSVMCDTGMKYLKPFGAALS